MARAAEMKRKMIEQRDQLLTEIEGLKNKVKGLEMAIALMDGEELPSQGAPSSRRSGMKSTVLDMLKESGTTGLNAIAAVEMAQRRNVHLDRQSVSSLLSRLKKDGLVVYEGERYKLAQFATGAGTTMALRVVAPAS